MENQDLKTNISAHLQEKLDYVKKLLKENIPNEMAVVKLDKTHSKLAQAQTLVEEFDLTKQQEQALLLAIIFTDVGYTQSLYTPYNKSIKIVESYLANKEIDNQTKQEVINCLSVKAKIKTAESLVEKIYQDTQFSIFAEKQYLKEYLPDIQAEDQLNRNKPLKKKKWLKEHRKKLKELEFNTKAGKENFQSGVVQNAKKLNKLRKKKKKAVLYGPLDERGVQTIFKTALRNHTDLTNIADNKAGMMLSINAIIITIALPLLMSYIEGNRFLVIPLIVLMITCVVSVIFAALATQPGKLNGETSLEKVMSKSSSNLFFFGNFYNIDLNDYQKGVKDVIRDSEVLERSIINDLYFLGKALGKKFILLRVCYRVFMIGIALSVVAFGLVLYLVNI